MAPAPTSTENITPPRSSHGQADSWGYNMSQKEDYDNDMNSHDFPQKNHFTTQNGNSNSYHSGMDRVGRKVNSHDNLSSTKLHNSVDGIGGRHIAESQTSPALNGSSWGQEYGPHETEDEYSRNAVPIDQPPDEGSKWIHRDKLARIESEELQAAGIYIPRSRNQSKQRRGDRDRSRSAMRRGTDTSETRSRKNSTAVDSRSPEIGGESWDLRTPEEIAEEENNAYFHANSHKGGSRIPVAKARPGSSHMMKGSDAMSINSNFNNSSLPAPKRTATDNPSPKKNANGPRKTSAPSKTATGTNRPKTRSGSVGNSITNATRPTTRSGELSPGNKAPEGDPPWMINSYKPDPRLPPDQQLLPTVARRLQQEKWEKEGKFGDVYDKDFRPLNDNALGKEHHENRSGDETDSKEKEEGQAGGEWPLKLEPKSPTQRAGGYSTMPRISDKPTNSPLPSPRTPMSPNAPLSPNGPGQEQPKEEQSAEQPVQQQQPQRQQPADDDSKGGCGCCVVM
ncbi:hypothetical protein FPOA_02039 [Fusarium poae]|uniref:TeaA receptor TeaR n=1 Tax=Fusarium poae TaxID=36050 RepID=A0A1B8B5V2_FUSPO|nr:hypothetical protein FPOA_02039 [Fusarium poae]